MPRSIAKRLFAKIGEFFQSQPTRFDPRTRLALNQLEPREVPAVYVYDPTGAGANDWTNLAKWKDEVTGNNPAVAPGNGDTAKFPAQVAVAVNVPGGTTISTLIMQAGTGVTLQLAGTLVVNSGLQQYAGTINDGALMFEGGQYLWSGGKRTGNDAGQDQTQIGGSSALKLGYGNITLVLDGVSLNNFGHLDCTANDGAKVNL